MAVLIDADGCPVTGKSVNLEKGDMLLIKPYEKHRVSFTSSEPPCVWLCVFY